MSALEYSRFGSGEPLVLLHGIGDSRLAWSPVQDRLATRYDVFTVDLPGFGESAALPPGTTPSPAALADAVAAWLDAQGLDTVHLVGSSLGGWIALELAARGRARSVVGLSPAGFWSDRDRAAARRLLRLIRRTAQLVVPVARGTMSPRVARLTRPAVVRTVLYSSVLARPWRMPADLMQKSTVALSLATGWDLTLAAMTGERYHGPSGGLAVPVTLVWGAKDRLLPPHQRARAKELLPQARVGVLPGCGHLPMWDDPDLVTRVVLTATGQLD